VPACPTTKRQALQVGTCRSVGALPVSLIQPGSYLPYRRRHARYSLQNIKSPRPKDSTPGHWVA